MNDDARAIARASCLLEPSRSVDRGDRLGQVGEVFV